MLSDKYPPDAGGLAVSAQRLAQGLAAAGHDVCVLVPDAALLPSQLTRIVSDNLVVCRFGTSRREDDTRVDWFEWVVRLHRKTPFDLLHGYYVVGAGFVAVYAARYLGLPVVVSARGNDLERAVFHPGRGGSGIWALQQADVVTAVSYDLARKARALAPTARVEVIHNGVDAAFFRPTGAGAALRQQLGIPPQAPVLGFVGEARQKKGLTVLLLALAQLAQTYQEEKRPLPWLLLVGGVRPEEKEVLQVFKAQHPQIKVKSFPYLPASDLLAYYDLFDLLLLPSLRDGLPNALLEGMACECAILATEVGGIPDVLHHGETGWLIEPGDVAALATAVTYLCDYPDLRAQLGRAARQFVLQHVTLAQELQANLDIYGELVDDTVGESNVSLATD